MEILFSLKTKAANFDFSTMVYLKAQYYPQSYLIYMIYPQTNSQKFIYGDDLAMAYQHQNFENVENGLDCQII
jgi:hypothetical protein